MITKIAPTQNSYISKNVKFLVKDASGKIQGFIKDCAECRQEFTAKQPSVKTCSPECAKAHKSQKLSHTQKGKTPWNKGKTDIYSNETKAKMGSKNKGKALSEEHRKTIGFKLKAYYQDHTGPNAGKPRDVETITKTKESLKALRPVRIKTTLAEASTYCSQRGLILLNTTSQDGLVSKLEKIEVQCKCGKAYTTTLNYLDFGSNLTCKGCAFSTSNPELEIYEFIKAHTDAEVLQNKRPDFLNRKELDIWIPEKQVAVEFHGLVHHSERSVFYQKDLKEVKTLHEYKYYKCKEAGIKLIQIFEDEWANKQKIVESMLLARLGISERIYARKTEVRKVSKADLRAFMDENHISGSSQFMTGFGLYVDGVLVSALTLRATWNKAYGEKVVEIARFASLLHTTVIGGFSKLMKEAKAWSLEHGFQSILTYADCRFGSGQVYKQYGFEYLGKTRPNYFYEKNGVREDRFAHRKNNNPAIIEKYGETERAQNNNQGWFAIYDAGNEIYLLRL